jgi:abhydrolase domain-containing protein 6
MQPGLDTSKTPPCCSLPQRSQEHFDADQVHGDNPSLTLCLLVTLCQYSISARDVADAQGTPTLEEIDTGLSHTGKTMWLTVLLVVATILLILLLSLNYVFPEFTVGRLMALRLKAGGFTDKRLAIPGFTIACWEAGQGEPLVLVHGMGGGRGSLLDVAEKLKLEYRVILPDLPGFGDSDKPPNADYSITAQVENLRQIILALGLSRVHLGGHSMGGWVGAGFAATHPDMVATLWLIAAAGSSDLEHGLAMQAYRQGKYILCCERPSDLRNIMKLLMVKVPRLPHCLWVTLGRPRRR